MKFLFLILFSVNAFAFPALNDLVKYEVTQKDSNGTIAAGTMEVQLVEFNATDNTFKQRTTTTMKGQPQVEETWVKKEDLVTDEQITNMLAMCAQIGGKTEMVTTKAGHFDTCMMTTDDNNALANVWLGSAPFGVIKLNNKDKTTNETLDAVLVEFKNGQ